MAARGSERCANGDFAAATRRTREEEIGQIRARNQQDENRRDLQHPQTTLRLAGKIFAQRHDLGSYFRIRVRILALQILSDSVHVFTRKFGSHAGLEPRDYCQIVGVPVGPLLGGKRKRRPVVDVAFAEEKIARHDADDGSGDAVEKYTATNDGGIVAKTALPKRVADYRNFGAGLVFLGGERTAEHGLHAEHVEEIGRNFLAGKLLGLAVAGQAGSGESRSRHIREHLVLCAPLDVIAWGGRVELETDE